MGDWDLGLGGLQFGVQGLGAILGFRVVRTSSTGAQAGCSVTAPAALKSVSSNFRECSLLLQEDTIVPLK